MTASKLKDDAFCCDISVLQRSLGMGSIQNLAFEKEKARFVTLIDFGEKKTSKMKIETKKQDQGGVHLIEL